MQFSVGVEYAFHSLFYMVDLPGQKTIGIKQIAELNQITESYLSKVFAKLRKSGIVRSVTGVKGGYELARQPEAITFWDVIEAIEGPSYYFQCAEIRKKNIFVEDPSEFKPDCPCLIKVAIQESEDVFRESLKKKNLRWLHDQVKKNFSEKKRSAIKAWMTSL